MLQGFQNELYLTMGYTVAFSKKLRSVTCSDRSADIFTTGVKTIKL